MQVVERHIIDRKDPRYQVIDDEAFKSKNLYNAALYVMRQSFIFECKRLSHSYLEKHMQQNEAYKMLPAKVAQKVLDQLDKDWDSYFKACKEYKERPEKFYGHPKLPKYKDKAKGRNLLIYTDQAVSRKGLKRGYIQPCMLPIRVRTMQKEVDQVRIIPKNGFYVVEVVYERTGQPAKLDPALIAGIDVGVNNLAAVTSNKKGFIPQIVNGRPLKSINQYYNKREAELQKKLGHAGTTKRIERITNRRTRRIDHYMHTASKRIIALLVKEEIGTLVIGKNDGWKQGVEMRKKDKQNFVYIPHARFIHMLSYKAELVGIQVILTEESYTSQASFLDRDYLPKYDPKDRIKHKFSGRRKKGIYEASGKRLIHSDVQGSYNIIRKVAPKTFEGVEDAVVVHPVRIALTKPRKKAF